MSPSRRPLGAAVSGVAALLAAAPTMVFPADSPTEPKLMLLALGTVLFSVAVVRMRAESAAIDGRPTRDQDITDE